MAKDNNQARKDATPIFDAMSKVQAAQQALDAARQDLNHTGEAWLRKHGAKGKRNLAKKGEPDRIVETYQAKPFVGDDGMLYEVFQRFTESGPNVVVRSRELG